MDHDAPIDPDYANDMNDSAEMIFSRFSQVQDFVEGTGVFGTTRSWGELSNGRELKSLFSYANVWNEFSMEHFMSRVSNTFSNLLWGSTDVENTQLNREALISFAIIIIFAGNGFMHACNKLYNKSKSQKIIEQEMEVEQHKYGYYNERREKKSSEVILDIFETSLVAFLLFTATVHFVGITNVSNDKSKGIDTFISESYSVNWYYITTLLTLSSQKYIRSLHGTETRDPTSFDLHNTSRVAFDLVLLSIRENPITVLHKILGSDWDTTNSNDMVSQLMLTGYIGYRITKMVKYVYNYGNSHPMTSAIIDMHANMLKEKQYEKATALRKGLLHNKTFRRAIMTHVAAI